MQHLTPPFAGCFILLGQLFPGTDSEAYTVLVLKQSEFLKTDVTQFIDAHRTLQKEVITTTPLPAQ